MLSTRVKLGLGGASLLAIGIWCPDVEYAFGLGSRTFWYEGIAVVFVLFGLAVYAALGVVTNSRKAVLTAGVCGAAGIGGLYLHRSGETSYPFMVHMSWGWGVLAAGVLLLLMSGVFPARRQRPRN